MVFSSVGFCVGFIAGVMFGRHNKNKAVLIDDTVDDVANKVMDKIKEKVQNATATSIKDTMLYLAHSDTSIRRTYHV